MTRSARGTRPGSLQFIVSRFVGRGWFMAHDIERRRYLTLFGNAMDRTDWRCLAYCLMGDELQFAMIAGEQPLDSWAKRVNSPYAHWLNRHRDRIGPIFADRPADRAIASDRALDLIAYIHNGPVRAGYVQHAAEIAFSSHRAYVGLAQAPHWLHVAAGLHLTGCADQSADFDAEVNRLRNCPVPPAEAVPDTSFEQVKRVTSDQVLNAVVAAFGLPRQALHRRHIRGDGSEAKRVAIHVARAVEIPLAEMAAALGVTRQRASQVASAILPAQHRAVVDEIVLSLTSAETECAG